MIAKMVLVLGSKSSEWWQAPADTEEHAGPFSWSEGVWNEEHGELEVRVLALVSQPLQCSEEKTERKSRAEHPLRSARSPGVCGLGSVSYRHSATVSYHCLLLSFPNPAVGPRRLYL